MIIGITYIALLAVGASDIVAIDTVGKKLNLSVDNKIFVVKEVEKGRVTLKHIPTGNLCYVTIISVKDKEFTETRTYLRSFYKKFEVRTPEMLTTWKTTDTAAYLHIFCSKTGKRATMMGGSVETKFHLYDLNITFQNVVATIHDAQDVIKLMRSFKSV